MSGLSGKHAAIQAAILAQGCLNLRSPDVLSLNKALFAPLVGEPNAVTGGVHSPTVPAFFAVADAKAMYLVLDGILTWQQALGIADGYLGGLLDSVTSPENSYFAAATVEIDLAIRNGGLQYPPVVYIGGFSLGGVIGCLLPAFAGLDNPAQNTCTVHSFGSPRPGSTYTAHRIDGSCRLYRWMLQADPIPMVPPRARDFPAILPAFGVRGALRAQNFVHPAGGISVGTDGSVSITELPSKAAPNFTLSLAQWYLDYDAGRVTEHTMDEYTRRLGLTVELLKTHGVIAGAEIEKADKGGATDVRRQAHAFAINVRALEERQNSAPFITPRPALFIPEKANGTWIVSFSNQIIAACGSRRAAQGLARRGNDFLRDLQRRAAVDPSAVSQSLDMFLTAAQDPESGFSPLLNTEFP